MASLDSIAAAVNLTQGIQNPNIPSNPVTPTPAPTPQAVPVTGTTRINVQNMASAIQNASVPNAGTSGYVRPAVAPNPLAQAASPNPTPAPAPVLTPASNQAPQSLRERAAATNAQPTVLKQGDTYEESYSEEESEEEYDEEETPKKGLNLKVIAIVGIVAVLIIIFLILQGGKDKKEEEQVSTDVVTETVEYIPGPTEILGAEEFADTSSTYNTPEQFYTDTQITNLRAVGMTAVEIEDNMNRQIPYDKAYGLLRQKYYARQLETKLPLYDLTNDLYKTAINNTWLTLDIREDVGDWRTTGTPGSEWTEDNLCMQQTVTKNLDYEKVEPRGSQLFIKVYFDDYSHDNWFFVNVTPTEWERLGSESGNVVVNYTYQTHFYLDPEASVLDRVEDTEHIFVTQASLSIIDDRDNGGY